MPTGGKKKKKRKTACLLICFLIEFLLPFLCLVNPCTGLWADDWRVITSCRHVCFSSHSARGSGSKISWTISTRTALLHISLPLQSAPNSSQSKSLLSLLCVSEEPSIFRKIFSRVRTAFPFQDQKKAIYNHFLCWPYQTWHQREHWLS